MAYPVAGQIEHYQPAGYSTDHAMVPHGTSVIVHTPAVCRMTARAAPARHLQAAAALGADVADVALSRAGDVLADRVLHFMRITDQPMGIAAFGYTEADIPRLVDGTLMQARLLKLSPIDPTPDVLTALFRGSVRLV
jgi:hydroxyacid-oxoacid transhydrogenase